MLEGLGYHWKAKDKGLEKGKKKCLVFRTRGTVSYKASG